MAKEGEGLIRPRGAPSMVWAVSSLILLALLIFWPAHDWTWGRGWRLYLLFSFSVAAGTLHLWRVNPELFAARRRLGKGTKRWDYVLLTLLAVGLASVPSIAALDHRKQWAPQPEWLVICGYVLVIAAIFLVAWAQGVNRHFETTVRIQTDRGHAVIDNGPYRWIRHPGYAGAALLAIGAALSLGSLWALVPVAGTIAVLVIRTALEDRTLRDELPGYEDYAARTRHRLVPGIW